MFKNKNMKILINGVVGFLGSNLASGLFKREIKNMNISISLCESTDKILRSIKIKSFLGVG